MRAIDYGIKNFGGFSYTGNNNIYVFNDEIQVERETGENTTAALYLIQLTPVNGQFEIANDPKIIHSNELYYLQESGIVDITVYDNVEIYFAGTETYYRTVYKINDEFYAYEVTNLQEVVLSATPNKSIIEARDPVKLVNDILKDKKMSVVMFISSDGARITRAYQAVTDLYDHEMVLFIEVNDDGNLFGSVIKVKSGKNINSIGVFPLQNISKLVEIYNTQIDPGSFRKILEDHVRNKDGERMYFVKRVIFGIFDRVVVFTAGLPLLAISKVSSEISGFLGGLLFKESSWRYYDDNGTPSEESDLFLPGIDFFKALSAATDETQKTSWNQEELVKKSISRLEDLKLILTAKFAQKKSAAGGNFFFKDSFSKVIQHVFRLIDHTIILMKKMFKKLSLFLLDGFIMVNALIVGVIDVLIEAVKGLFELVHLIADAVLDVMEKGRDVTMNFGSYVMFFIELIENKIETFLNLFSLKNFTLLFDFFLELFPLLITLGSNAIDRVKKGIEDISIPNIDVAAYYTGYLIGMIVELILETLATAGATVVVRGVKASAATFKKIGANFLKLSGKAAGTTRELIDVLLDLFNTLRKNSKNLKPLLDDILDYIRDMAGLVTRQVTDFFATFGLTLKKVKQPALYSGIPIPVGDDVYALSKNGKEIFRGTKKEIDELAEKLRKMSDEDARKYVDDLVKGNKLKLAKQMWKEFEYKHLMEIPPSKKPCFLAGTLVKTENGHVPIEQLKAGNKVFTYNLEKKQTEINAVTRVYENVTQKYLKITTKSSCIEATGQHRFWIPKQEKWLMANELKSGMHFLDTHKNEVEVLDLQIIESAEKTFNLEIENNHNYFVGQDEILTHNTNKVFKFADETLYDFGFYLLAETDAGRVKSELYVGITTQPFDVRNSQHAQEGKAASKYNKPYNAWKANADLLRIKPDYTKMTFYEATVWETYFINERGGGKAHKGLGKLLNRKTPISEKMFNDMKKTGKFNPCKYFI